MKMNLRALFIFYKNGRHHPACIAAIDMRIIAYKNYIHVWSSELQMLWWAGNKLLSGFKEK